MSSSSKHRVWPFGQKPQVPQPNTQRGTPYYEALQHRFRKPGNLPPPRDRFWTEQGGLVTEQDLKIAKSRSLATLRWLRETLDMSTSINTYSKNVLQTAQCPRSNQWTSIQPALGSGDKSGAVYRAQTDWISMWVSCAHTRDFPILFNDIARAVANAGGSIQYDVKGFFKKITEKPDMVERFYLFLPHIGYLVEIRLATQIAFWMWSRDQDLQADRDKVNYLPNYGYGNGNIRQAVQRGSTTTADASEALRMFWLNFEKRNLEYLKMRPWLDERRLALRLLEPVLSVQARNLVKQSFPILPELLTKWRAEEGERVFRNAQIMYDLW